VTTQKRWKWGVVFSGENLSLEEILHFSLLAEDAGAESLWSLRGLQRYNLQNEKDTR